MPNSCVRIEALVRVGCTLAAILLVPAAVRGQPTCSLGPNQLRLRVADLSQLCLRPGDQLSVTLSMDCMSQSASGYQAFLSFDAAMLEFVSGSYASEPFGLPLINPISANGNAIDLAAGVNVFSGQQASAADATLATLVFRARAVVATSAVVFRPHNPDTKFSAPDGSAIPATKVDSQAIHVSANCFAPCGPGVGDANGDQQIDVADAAAAANVLLGLDTAPAHVTATDANCDGHVDGRDIQPLVMYLLAFGI